MPSDQQPQSGNGPAPTASAPAPVAVLTGQAQDQFFASISPGLDKPLPERLNPLAAAILEYERITEQPTLVVLQKDGSDSAEDSISYWLAEKIIDSKPQIGSGRRNLVLHTCGGNPNAGYRIVTFLQKTGGFDVLIPKMAKSAGTLMILGAQKTIMGEMAELGPLDMQVKDEETEVWDSALNETKALQTLSREALLLYSSKMELLSLIQEGKSFQTRNKIATEFVNEMIRPLVEKIDAVHFTKMARIMEIMKAYGRQLMRRAGYPPGRAIKLVNSLGEDYPDHGYVIDAQEARELGLRVESPKQNVASLIETITPFCDSITVIGRITRAGSNQTSA